MSLPNFFIFGAAKSGTTSLQMYLKQHPDIFFPEYKEPNFYALEGQVLPKPGPAAPKVIQDLIYSRSITKRDEYEALFNAASGQKFRGEASVRYLYFEGVAEKIHRDVPDARLIAVLREPVARLYSHYCMNVQYQLEPLGLMDAVEAEEQRRDLGWGWDWNYVGLGLYAKQLKRYFELFNREQIKVFFYDDFVKDPMQVIHASCEHLNISSDFVPDMSRKGKVAYRGRNLAIDRWLHWPNVSRQLFEKVVPATIRKPFCSKLREWNRAPVPMLAEEDRLKLQSLFSKDIEELGSLLGCEVPWTY